MPGGTIVLLFNQNAIQGVPFFDNPGDFEFITGKPLEWITSKPLEYDSMEIKTFELFTGDVRNAKFNFSGEKEFKVHGQTITSATTTCTPVNLITGSDAIDSTGSIVEVPVSGASATPGMTYTLTTTAVWSGGATLQWQGRLWCPA